MVVAGGIMNPGLTKGSLRVARDECRGRLRDEDGRGARAWHEVQRIEQRRAI